MVKQLEKSGVLQFEVDAGLLFQLGEQLVARRSIALAELIKNSYDADATKVTVLLDKITQPGGTIIIEDDGIGMTFEDIRDHWMRIATDDKVRNPFSPMYGRPRTGAKGIGRFAARRLAHKMILHSVASRPDGRRERVVVEFDWENSFKPGQTLTEIPVTYQRSEVEQDTPTSVTLYLENVRDAWRPEDLSQLRRDLFSLVTPFPKDLGAAKVQKGKRRDPGFSMKLEIPEFPELGGELEEQFLAAAWGVLTGRIDDRGTPHYHLDIRTTKEGLNFVPKEEHFDALPDVKFKIHFFVYKADYFKGLDFSLREAQQMGREQGGVRIYLNGFRVFPYGDPGDDWLKLNEIRASRTRYRQIPLPRAVDAMEDEVPGRPLLLIPGNNQVFGTVAISQTNHYESGRPRIELNISRERLVENEAFFQLQRFVHIGIYWMTVHYARVKAKEDARWKKTEAPTVIEIVEQARSQVLDLKELSPESQRGVIQLLDYAKERAETEEAEHISEISMLRVMTSAGATVFLLNHQLRTVVDGIRAIHTDLRELGEQIPQRIGIEYDKIVNRLGEWRTMVMRQASSLGFLLAPETRLHRRRLALREVVENVTSPLSLYMRDFGITFENQVPANLRTPPIFEAELYAMLLHIFTNALKAVKDRAVSKISVKADQQSDGLHIYMLDTGVGIEPERREKVFEAFETTSTPDPILGVGTGLGLKVVRDILETYGGTARFIDAEAPWRTCIEIYLPKEG